jgi:hypothetical protein
MSYLLQHLRRPASETPQRGSPRVDRREWLNLPGFYGDAAVRAYVADTSSRRNRRTPPAPELELWISDCYNKINLEFDVSTHELRVNSLHKIDTLLDSLRSFRDGLVAEADLRAQRERH